MKLYSQHYITPNKDSEKPIVLIVTDQDPEGVTITIRDNLEGGAISSFNLPRIAMINALEYIVKKLKTTVDEI